MDFNVYYSEKICGNVSTYEQDIFLVFEANCDIVSLNICRIFLKKGDLEMNLGVLMPKNGRYVLKKKLLKSYIAKIALDNGFKAFIKCENDSTNIISTKHIVDKNLKKCINERVFKENFDNFDFYSFIFDENSPFIFDFCPTLCDFSQNRIILKTDKTGKIYTK